MHRWPHHIFRITLLCFAVLLASMAVSASNVTTASMFGVSVAMFLTCGASALHLFGVRSASCFAAIALGYGWFVEELGTRVGWPFGEYQFTDALGPRLASVPVVIPLMWFNLTYMGYVISNLIIWRAPLDGGHGFRQHATTSFLSALVVTAYDLGADPYMVYTIGAWVMKVRDGWWFGETIQGFFGWVLVAFLIACSFRALSTPPRPLAAFSRRHVWVPLAVYACLLAFQVTHGQPVETRTIAVFAMGLPLACAAFGLQHWRWSSSSGRPG